MPAGDDPDPAARAGPERRKKARKRKKDGAGAPEERASLAVGRRLARATPLLRAVDQHYVQRLFGEPAGSLLFDAGETREPACGPAVLEVPFWSTGPDAPRPLTRLATLGMSAATLAGGTRVELAVAVARALDAGETTALAVFLANLAAYPFFHETALAAGDFLTSIGEIPAFPGFSAVAIDWPGPDPAERGLELPGGTRVDLLLAIPVLPPEVALLRAYGIDGLRAHWAALGLDRLDPARPASY